jgi:hypothetical protein
LLEILATIGKGYITSKQGHRKLILWFFGMVINVLAIPEHFEQEVICLIKMAKNDQYLF